MVENSEISVVIQGPTQSSRDRPMAESVTARSISAIRRRFPGAQIIVSTWEGQPTECLDCDHLVINKDPGPSIHRYKKSGEPYKVNVNRQIVSTLGGLKKVQTKYAIKLRSDNVLHSDRIKDFLNKYPRRTEEHKYFRERVIVSNIRAYEFSAGLPVPFFFSDFFQFGLTEDLIALWDQPLFKDYKIRESLLGKRQHADYPWPQICVEQYLWSGFLEKFMDLELYSKFALSSSQKKLSDQIFANNLVILDQQQIGLEVPKRLEQNQGFPYTYYSHMRWRVFYKKYCDPDHEIDGELAYKLTFTFARTLMYMKLGIEQQIRLLKCRLQTSAK